MNTIPMRRSHLVSNAGNRPFSPRFSAAVMVKEIMCKTPGRSSPEDYAVGYLLHSVPGLEAKFADNGQPLTRIICQHQLPRKAGQSNTPGRGGKTPTDLALLKSGSSQVTPHVTWQTIVFENARLESRDPTGNGLPSIKASYLTAGPTAQERGLLANPSTGQLHKTKETLFFPTLVMPRKDNGTGRSYQKIALSDPTNAVTITNEDDLRAAIAQRIETTAMGYPGFMIISRQLAPANYSQDDAVNFARDPSTRDASICLLSPYPVDAYGRRVEPGTNVQVAAYQPGTLDDGLASIRPEHRAHSLFHPGWQHSLVPLLGFPQSLFAYDKAHDPATHYRFDESGYGFADSIVTLTESRNGSGGWVSSFQKPVNSCGDIIAPEETITADMPPYHRIAAEEMVRQNTAERLQRAAEAAANYQNRSSAPAPHQPGPGYNHGGYPEYGPGPTQPQQNWGPGDGQMQGYPPQGYPSAPHGYPPQAGYGPPQQQYPGHYAPGQHQGPQQHQMRPNQTRPQQYPNQDQFAPPGPQHAPQGGHNQPTPGQHTRQQQPQQPQRPGPPPRQPAQHQAQGRGQGQRGWHEMGPNDDVEVDW